MRWNPVQHRLIRLSGSGFSEHSAFALKCTVTYIIGQMMIYRDKKELSGALLAAFSGTAAMTVAMVLMHRALPRSEQQPLPPYHISMNVAERLGLRKRMDEEQRFATTMLLHVGYGTIVGSLYVPFGHMVPGRSVFKGMLFGVLVWGGSYLGWLPSTGLLSSAKHHAACRNALMIAAHLVWGTTTAMLAENRLWGHSASRFQEDHTVIQASPARQTVM